MEILRELYWEAKRAPSINTTAIKNPYRREFLKKKFLGKTREERLAFEAKLNADDSAHRLSVDEGALGLIADQEVKTEGLRKKRRENAAKRLSLGFNDAKAIKEADLEKEGVVDNILEDLEHKNREYQKQIEEQKERKPVRLVTDVKGISKDEIDNLMLRDSEKFRKL